MKIRLSIMVKTNPPVLFEHAGPVIRIGRDPECELTLQGEASDLVSRHHARIDLRPDGALLTDTGSSNGTLLNGERLQAPISLCVGDRVQMGFTGALLTVLQLELTPPPPPRPAGKAPGKPPRPPRRAPVPSPASSVVRPLPLVLGTAAVVLACVLVAGIVLVCKALTSRETAEASPPETTADKASPPPSPAVPPPSVPPVDPEQQPEPVERPMPPSARGAPSEEVKQAGTYVADEGQVSVLLQRPGAANPWSVLRPGSSVSTAETLISLPGYRSVLGLENDVTLTLWGNLPEFSSSPPVLESVVMLHVPSAGTDLDFTLDRGRVRIANRKSPAAPARIHLRFLQQSLDVELPDDKSELAVDLWGLPEKARTDSLHTLPPTYLDLYTRGPVVLKTARETLSLPDRTQLTWSNQDPTRLQRANLPDLPAWWSKPDPRTSPAVKKACASLLDWCDRLGGSTAKPQKGSPAGSSDSVATLIKTQVEEMRDPDDEEVGILFLAALDKVEAILDVMKDRQKGPNVRGTAIFALQLWLSRGGSHAEELIRILKRRDYSDKAETVVRLLYFFQPEDLNKRETYEQLITCLNDDVLLVRDLAFWQLDQLGAGGFLPEEARKIVYDPVQDAAKRAPAVQQWRQLLAEGKLPALPVARP